MKEGSKEAGLVLFAYFERGLSLSLLLSLGFYHFTTHSGKGKQSRKDLARVATKSRNMYGCSFLSLKTIRSIIPIRVQLTFRLKYSNFNLLCSFSLERRAQKLLFDHHHLRPGGGGGDGGQLLFPSAAAAEAEENRIVDCVGGRQAGRKAGRRVRGIRKLGFWTVTE
jgi:hypothetical protein